jgi:hypothetical protein
MLDPADCCNTHFAVEREREEEQELNDVSVDDKSGLLG